MNQNDPMVPVPLSLLQRCVNIIEGLNKLPDGETVASVNQVVFGLKVHADSAQVAREVIEAPKDAEAAKNGERKQAKA